MRLRSSLLFALLAAAPPVVAQVPSEHHGWHLGGGADAVHFGHVAVSDAAPGVAARLRPSGRLAVHLTLARSAGPWNLSLEADWAEGRVEARNDVIAITDLTTDTDRYRLAVGLGRRLTPVGTGALYLQLAPTLDLWSLAGESRLRGGAELRLALRVPLGPVELEHRLGFGVSGSPVEATDVGSVSDERGLRALLVGVGVRTRL